MVYTAMYSHEMKKVKVRNDEGDEIIVSSCFGIPNIGNPKYKEIITDPDTEKILDVLFRTREIPKEVTELKKQISELENKVLELNREYERKTQTVWKIGEYNEIGKPIQMQYMNEYGVETNFPRAVIQKHTENEYGKMEHQWIDVDGEYHRIESKLTKTELEEIEDEAEVVYWMWRDNAL